MNKNENKLVLFFGENPIDQVCHNGEYVRLGKWTSDDLHVLCFSDYWKKHFQEIPAFGNLTYRNYINDIAVHFARLGHAMFVNTTKDVKAYGYTGFFTLPNYLTEEQIQMIQSLFPELEGFRIVINYDFTVEDGYINCKTIENSNRTCVESIFECYLEEMNLNLHDHLK